VCGITTSSYTTSIRTTHTTFTSTYEAYDATKVYVIPDVPMYNNPSYQVAQCQGGNDLQLFSASLN